MRDIIFRGKRIDNGEWVYGYYARLYGGKKNKVSCRIYTGSAETDCDTWYPNWFEVVPATIGQYTGLIDKHGRKIFEGDIISIPIEEDRSPWKPNWIYYKKAKVYFDTKRYGWYVEFSDYYKLSLEEYDETGIEVICNIHDNPELLKGAEK